MEQLPDGSYIRQKRPLKALDVQEHLQELKTISIYQLDEEDKIKWIGFDIDSFGAKHKAETLCEYLKTKAAYKNSYLKEQTGGRGYHVWLFFKPKISAAAAKIISESITKHASVDCEIFPKQTKLSASAPYGSGLRLPLGKHQKYGRKSVLEYPKSLSSIKPAQLPDSVINELERIAQKEHETYIKEKTSKKSSIIRCLAIDELFKGVNEGVRDDAAFTLARFYKELGNNATEVRFILEGWNRNNEVPLQKAQLVKCINSAFRKGAAYSFGCATFKENSNLKSFCARVFDRCGLKHQRYKKKEKEIEAIPEL